MSGFMGFTFCGIHSSKFNVYAISDSSGYKLPLFAKFNDIAESVDGHDGEYYFGTNYRRKTRIVNCFVENVDEITLRNIQKWLNPKRMGKLTFDEAPYKYYNVKVVSVPELNFVPSTHPKDNNTHVYTGTFAIEFVAYDPFAYSYANSVEDYTYYEESQGLWYYDSGILYQEETPPVTINNITGTTNCLLYNGGNAKARPVITITGSADKVTIFNQTTKQQFTLENLDDVSIIVDCKKGHVRVADVLANSYHAGGFIELEGNSRVDRYMPVEFTNGSNLLTIEGILDLDIIGRYIAVDSTWYKIIDYDFNTGLMALDRSFEGTGGAYNISIIDLNEINISGVNLNISSIKFDYKFCYM